ATLLVSTTAAGANWSEAARSHAPAPPSGPAARRPNPAALAPPPSPPPSPSSSPPSSPLASTPRVRYKLKLLMISDQKNVNFVLQECMTCGNVPMIDLLSSHLDKVKQQKCDASQQPCSWANNFSVLSKICSNGCDLTSVHENYQIPLHFLVSGDIQGNWENLLEAVKFLSNIKQDQKISPEICHEPFFPLSITDTEGNTPLLILGRRLLKAGAFDQAAQLSKMLLEAGSDPNAVNLEGRSLLSYSINYMDDSVELTRVLLNGGASVWPLGLSVCGNVESVENVGSTSLPSEQCSAFTWFLRGVIRRRKLDEHCCRTLNLISEVMGEHPTRMHSHVMRTMFRHAKCYKVLGPVFYQLKIAMMRYWTQPLELRFMCRGTIRSAMGSERMLAGATSQLGLPSPLERYICLE
ncbi:Uncharacterized protein GBIM_16081, partial [Gryllus bimaculatus]